ncbi:MAG: hypothetical protein F6K30_24005, partial [Cyanothece sp. SIO2G6]|nr:hypothetical protein [Cyanothece sp. SIO2G6]
MVYHNQARSFQLNRGLVKTYLLPLILSPVLLIGGSLGPICPSAQARAMRPESLVSPTTAPMLMAQSRVVSITSAADAVAKFTPSQQLYIKGNPLTAEQVDRLLVTLNANPNVFVVLLDNSTNVVDDDRTLSRGIANTAGFESMRHPMTGERQGILFMVYFDSDQGRMIFMRSDELPDRLGVGEQDFADENGNPRKLLSMFLNAVRSEGKDVPGALEVVINHINGTINQRLARRQLIIRVVLGGLIVALLVILALLWRSAKDARLEAEEVLQKASRKLADRTQALLQLMEDAEYHSFKSYTGATATHAKTMLDHITNALALVGGAEVVLAEAETLVAGKGITNWVWSGNYRRAIALLTDADTALPLQKVGNLQALLKNQEEHIKEVWRSHLSTQTDTDAMNHSFQNILEQMAERRTTAMGLLQELIEKDNGIGDYLAQIKLESQGMRERAEALPTVGEAQLATEPWFTVPSLLTAIAPLLLDDKGYIAQGRNMMSTDPINAWNHYGDGAKRIVQEAAVAMDVATEGRSQLLTILEQGDRTLHPFQVRTDWAHGLMQELSQRLDQTVQESAQSSVADNLGHIRQAMQQLGDRIQTIVRQDNERRTVAPKQIRTATNEVGQARQQLCHTLQSLDLFRTGNPEGVLQEPDRNPSTHIATAQAHLDELKRLLDQGDEERSQSHLDTIAAETQTAHQLVAATQAAMAAYPQTLPPLKERILSLYRHCQDTTLPILEELQRAYAPEVLELV